MVDNGQKISIGRDLLSRLGLAVVQQQRKRGNCVNNFDKSTCKVKQAIALQIPQQVSRIELSKTHFVKSKLHKKFRAKHQNVVAFE